MKLSISNIALPAFEHDDFLPRLAMLGLSGLEVAPSRRWRNTWQELRATDVAAYRQAIETAGLEVVGLHSLLFDHQELELFGTTEQRNDLLAFFAHLSAVCRDLGGRTLIWGGGRHRGAVEPKEAVDLTVEFFGALADRIDAHGTCFCIEPLGVNDTDFVHSVFDSLDIVGAVDRASLKVQIDAKALYDNDEFDIVTFRAGAHVLVHYHANEPGLEVLGTSGQIDHYAAGNYLREIDYDGYVSIEQKMIGPENPLSAIEQSVSLLKEAYG